MTWKYVCVVGGTEVVIMFLYRSVLGEYGKDVCRIGLQACVLSEQVASSCARERCRKWLAALQTSTQLSRIIKEGGRAVFYFICIRLRKCHCCSADWMEMGA